MERDQPTILQPMLLIADNLTVGANETWPRHNTLKYTVSVPDHTAVTR
jgi:hypothetical protein